MAETARYSRADVAARDGRGAGAAVWIIFKDSVYDVTRYLNEHPGGDGVIRERAGQDATKDFQDVGHSSDAYSIMTKHKIGELIEEEKRYDANGKRVVVAPLDKPEGRSCLQVVTCGLLG